MEFAKSAVAFAEFWSNWFFLKIGGYFDGPAQLKPLLHTWSLSIEEQFYLISPVPILLVLRYSKSAVKLMLAAVFVASLAYSVALMHRAQVGTAFYSSIARFWEISLGGMLAAGVVSRPKSSFVRQVTGCAGLLAIIASMMTYSADMAFPGLSALIPTAGAALFILSYDSAANRMLSFKPVVAVGLISYALYLWHWPIFVLIEYAFIGAGSSHFLIGTAIAIALATASYFFVETPVRTGKILKSEISLSSAFAAGLAVQIGFGILVKSADGFPSRFPNTEYGEALLHRLQAAAVVRLRDSCWVGDTDFKEMAKRCVAIDPDKENLLLVGDSHAAQLFPALSTAWPDVNVDLMASDSCIFRFNLLPTCQELTQWLIDNAEANTLPYGHVLMTSRLDSLKQANDMASVAEKLVSHGIAVTFIGPIQYYRPNLPTMFPVMSGTIGRDAMIRKFTDAVQPEQFEADRHLKQRLGQTKVNYIPLLDITCPAGPEDCMHLDANDLPITLDDSHLSIPVAKLIVDRIAPAIRAVGRPSSGSLPP